MADIKKRKEKNHWKIGSSFAGDEPHIIRGSLHLFQKKLIDNRRIVVDDLNKNNLKKKKKKKKKKKRLQWTEFRIKEGTHLNISRGKPFDDVISIGSGDIGPI